MGLTCLDAATLSNSTKLYEPNNKFNYNQLEENIAALEHNCTYSEPLTLIIKSLCQVESEKRAICRELAEWLVKYDEDIVELREFAVQELPEKLRLLKPGPMGGESKTRHVI